MLGSISRLHGNESREFFLQKVRCITEIVASGESLAASYGPVVTDEAIQDAQSTVLAQMTPDEKELYNAWKNGATPPVWDFQENQKEITTLNTQNRRYYQHALSLNKIYKVTDITPEGAKGWIGSHPLLIPLVIAVKKVEDVSRNLVNDVTEKDLCELAESDAIRSTIALADAYLSREVEELDELKTVFTAMQNALQDRLRALPVFEKVRSGSANTSLARRRATSRIPGQTLQNRYRLVKGDRLPRMPIPLPVAASLNHIHKSVTAPKSLATDPVSKSAGIGSQSTDGNRPTSSAFDDDDGNEGDVK